LKPENILKFKNGTIKIADFGFSKLAEKSFVAKSQQAGSLHFMSPEMVNYQETEIGKATDIWSLAVCMFYLLESKFPFSGKNPIEIYNSILYKPPFPFERHISEPLQNLIISMLNKDQHLRITIEEIWAHPIFNSCKMIPINEFPSVISQPQNSSSGSRIKNFLNKLFARKTQISPNSSFNQQSPNSSPNPQSPNSSSNPQPPIPLQVPLIPVWEQVKNKSKLIQTGNPSLFQLTLENERTNKTKELWACEIGTTPAVPMPEKIILVVGATGSGKTTFINGVVNYLYNVEWNDNFRFKMTTEEVLESQGHSQTQFITSYTLHHVEGFAVPYTGTIIDTPGFVDARVIKQDEILISNIKSFFEGIGQTRIDSLDAIAFVVKASDSDLNIPQQYIFDSVLGIFGKDVFPNLFFIATFADSEEIEVETAIQEAKLPYEKIFKFNNNTLFKSNAAGNKIGKLFWDMGKENYEDFFSTISSTSPVSLTLTKKVLAEKHYRQLLAENLHDQIKEEIAKMNEMKQHEEIIKDLEAEFQRNRVSPFHFIWRSNQCSPVKTQQEKEIKQQMLNDLQKEYDAVKQKGKDLWDELTSVNHELRKIAAQPSIGSTLNYINFLIQSEEFQQQTGWQTRCSALNEIKEYAELIANIEKGEKLYS
jgi:GTPase SAR1 family protein